MTAALIDQITHDLIAETDLSLADPPRRTIAAEQARLHVPGVSVALLDHGEIAWAQAFGVLDIGGSTPCDAQTVFQAASISKPVNAALVLSLVDAGLLDLDVDVNTYLRSWQIPSVGDWQPRITLRQLLTHSAGLTVPGFGGYSPGSPIPTVPQVLSGSPPANSAPVVVDTVPGLQYRYSGGGTTITQLVCMEVTGLSYPELIRQRVLEPLGMTRSTFAQPLPSDWTANAARGVDYRGLPIDGGWNIFPELAAAGLWTTPTDLARFGLGLNHALATDGQFLSRASAQTMFTPHIAGDAGTLYSLGLGVYLSPIGGGTAYWHNGSNPGYKADWIMFGQSGVGMVVMTSGDNGFMLAQSIMRACARAYGWAGYQPPPRLRVYKPPVTRLGLYCGRFLVDDRLTLKVYAEGENLYAVFPGQPAVALIPVTETLFSLPGLSSQIDYKLDVASETFPELVIKQNGRTFTATRTPEINP